MASTVLIDKLLATVIQLKASDLHISVGQPPVVRHHGRLRRLDTKVLDSDDTTSLMKAIAPDRCQQELQEVGGADFAIAFGDCRFRVAIFKQKGFVGMVLRRIPNQFLTFEQIGMPEAVRRLIVRPRGLMLVTGPTGSGKTTSLASMVNFINENYDRHIITIEDPIEYYHTHKKCTVNQREIGVDIPNFAEGLRRGLRMDPDIILVGEHIVFATLHTSGAASTINRIIDVFPKEQQDQVRTQLSVALIGVLSQAILPRKPEGLTAAFEMMVVTPAIQNLIRENKVYRINSTIQTGRKEGMFLLEEMLFKLWKDGVCEKEEVLLKTNHPADLAHKIAQAERGLLDEDEEYEDNEEDEDDYEDEEEDEDEEEEDERPKRRR